MSSSKLGTNFIGGEFSPGEADKAAAWELYVEFLSRITTQGMLVEHGDEKTALGSVFAIFGLTREILRKHGPGRNEFAKLAIPVMNQIIRPFTAKWHKLSMSGAFYSPARCQEFRTDLSNLQPPSAATPKSLPTWSGWRI